MSVYQLGELENSVEKALAELTQNEVVSRIWEKDHTVWRPDPQEISNRLAWLHSPDEMLQNVDEIMTFVQDVVAAGITHAVLLGMGGSSLAPEVFRFSFGIKEGFLDLAVLDSTHPGSVLEYADRFDPKKTLYIVSTKSGGTVETLSFLKYFYNLVRGDIEGVPGSHFVAITDPDSSLSKLAEKLSFRKTFLNNPDIGGRYSVLSYFGLVPAALIGIDIKKLLLRARNMANTCRETNATQNPGAKLGAALSQATLAGRNKATLFYSDAIKFLGAWVEQLVAESTGKENTGVVPIDLELQLEASLYAKDRLFIHSVLGASENNLEPLQKAGHPTITLELNDIYDLGAEFFRWEFATAIACERLKINPFDQPDVESAKIQARNMMTEFLEDGKLPTELANLETDSMRLYCGADVKNLQEALAIFFAEEDELETNSERSYVAIQAYLQPNLEIYDALQELRHQIGAKLKLATTIGFGPRFLHSTGQLHKGDSGSGLFLQITSTTGDDAAIPDEPGSDSSKISFSILISAQALGDREALLRNNRKTIRIHIKNDALHGIKEIQAAL